MPDIQHLGNIKSESREIAHVSKEKGLKKPTHHPQKAKTQKKLKKTTKPKPENEARQGSMCHTSSYLGTLVRKIGDRLCLKTREKGKLTED